jgi:hypothetical protein
MPDNPLSEGHYLVVSKNLVELLACLAIACLPTGHWIGLDALLFGWLRRRREARALAENPTDESTADIHPEPTPVAVPNGPEMRRSKRR